MRDEQMVWEYWETDAYYDEDFFPTPEQVEELVDQFIEEKRLEFYEEWFEYLDDSEWNSIF